MNLTENFTLEELTRTSQPFENKPYEYAEDNLKRLCACVLQPLRTMYGAPITVTSGFRSPEVNNAVGGVPLSQHLDGEAADITTFARRGNKQLFALIQSLDLPFDQLIDEQDYAWIHVSHSAVRNRRQVLHHE